MNVIISQQVTDEKWLGTVEVSAAISVHHTFFVTYDFQFFPLIPKFGRISLVFFDA